MRVVQQGRIAAELMMTATFEGFSPNGVTVVDGLEVPAFVSEGSTAGKFQGSSASSRDTTFRTVTVGGVPRPVLAGGLHLPIAAPVPRAGDQGVGWEYVCTAVGPEGDPALMGRRFLVVSVPTKSFATARRLDVVEVD